MSELTTRAGNLLHERWKAAHKKAIDAPETYWKLVVDPEPDPALAQNLVDAMDEMGIGTKELHEDLFIVNLARKIVPRMQANREAGRRAHEAVLAAERDLHDAQSKFCRGPIERAHYELAERIGEAADVERERFALHKEMGECIHKAPRVFRGRLHLAEQAMLDAEQRRAKKAVGSKGSSPPATMTDALPVPAAKAEPASRGGGNDEASRRIAAAASETVRQMMGQAIEANDSTSRPS